MYLIFSQRRGNSSKVKTCSIINHDQRTIAQSRAQLAATDAPRTSKIDTYRVLHPFYSLLISSLNLTGCYDVGCLSVGETIDVTCRVTNKWEKQMADLLTTCLFYVNECSPLLGKQLLAILMGK
jgi:hypothetical protein